jgi:hypothetical protein
MKKLISTQQTGPNIQEVLHLLKETPKRLKLLSRKLSPEQVHRPLGAGERSFVEALAHLIRCEAVTADSIQLALLREEPLAPGIHPERELGKLLLLEKIPFPDLLAYFRTRRSILLQMLESLTLEKWSRCVREPKKQRTESIYWQARALALHELEHLTDLEQKIND